MRNEDEAQPDTAPSKLDRQRGKARVLADDIVYLMSRMEQGSLATLAEHHEIQEEIHELQHILADWDSYVSLAITKLTMQRDVKSKVAESRTEKRIHDLENALLSYRDFLRNPTIAGDTFTAMSVYANALHERTGKLMGDDEE